MQKNRELFPCMFCASLFGVIKMSSPCGCGSICYQCFHSEAKFTQVITKRGLEKLGKSINNDDAELELPCSIEPDKRLQEFASTTCSADAVIDFGIQCRCAIGVCFSCMDVESAAGVPPGGDSKLQNPPDPDGSSEREGPDDREVVQACSCKDDFTCELHTEYLKQLTNSSFRLC